MKEGTIKMDYFEKKDQMDHVGDVLGNLQYQQAL
jgi:hypothetical protein